MQISIIVAASENNVIGKDNQLLWHLPNDLKFFKATTWAMPIVMGRRTFESLSGKALKGRMNIVITNNKDWKNDEVVVVNTITEAVNIAQQNGYKQLFIIGGGTLYEQYLPLANTIYLTRIHTNIVGDTFFPKLDTAWVLQQSIKHYKDEKHLYDYTFETCIRT